jgi:small subunit ribosomal protein S6e
MELKPEAAAPLLNRKIGLTGYKLKITGGSDRSGFPMQPSIEGTAKVRVLGVVAESGKMKGQKARKMQRGNMVTADTEQINTIIVEQGEKPLDELFPKKEKAEKKEEKAEKVGKEKKA